MRTRFLTKLTNGEVEDYLDTNDLIFIPVGVIETHGALPLDCETVLAEAIALKMAEETNGLVLHNLPYFFSGATPVARGTVQMSIKDGIDYLDKIAHSLLKQGFRRQVYVTSHGPAYLTVSPMVRDFFDQTKVPILYMDLIKSIEPFIGEISTNFLEMFNQMIIGAYSIMNRLEDVPLNMPTSDSVSYDMAEVMESTSQIPLGNLDKFAYQSGSIGYYFNKPLDHMYTPLLETVEDRAKQAELGVQAIHDIVSRLDMPTVVQSIKELDDYTQNVSMDKYGKWL